MKPNKIFILAAIVFCLTGNIAAESLASLMHSFKQRAGESLDSTECLVSDMALMDWLDQAQAKIVRIGGLLPKRVDVLFSFDSVKYGLPSDFKFLRYVLVRHGGKWHAGKPDPVFQSSTPQDYTYFQDWLNANNAELYAQGPYSEGDTLRVFYLGVASRMTVRTDTTQVPVDQRGLIIEEALSYYEWSKRNMAGYQVMHQDVRIDMGVQTKAKE